MDFNIRKILVMMKFFVFISLLLSSSILMSQAIVSPELNHIINLKSADEFVEVNIFFNDYYKLEELAKNLDNGNASFDKRVKQVVALLKENSAISMNAFYKENEIMSSNHKNLQNVNIYWGVNMLNVKVNIGSIIKYSEMDIIKYIDVNSPRYKIITEAKPENVSQKSVGGAEIGLKTINAHLLWELGYTGRNVLFLSMDTGVFPDHPAISDNFCGAHFPMEQCWYGVRSSQPADNSDSSHGTHTTGTTLGLDRATNDTIGVAFNSVWIASDPVASSTSELLTPTDFMDVFQWVFDPDGNPETTDDVPKVINNSWGYDYNLALQFGACELPEAEILVAIETAGICSPFSAGNEGPGVSTTGFPAMLAFNIVNPIAIGALEPSGDAIASFSSRGPSLCIDAPGQLQIKPEVSAPGVSVRSCIGNDEYGSLSGTSMACPHVSGALLLLAEAFPQANAFELKNSLYQTAIDLGEIGEDNTFGRGLIDVMAAYDYLAQTYTPEPPVTNEYDLVSEIISPELEMMCFDQTNFNSQIKITNDGTSEINNIQLFVYLNETMIVDSIIEITLAAGQEIMFETENHQFLPGKNYLHTVVKGIEMFREYDRFNNADIKYFYVIQKEDFPYQTGFNAYANDLSDLNWLIQNPDNLTGWKNLSWGTENQNKALGIDFLNYDSRNWEIDYANMPIISLPDNDELYFSFTYAYKKRVEYIFKDSLIVELSTDCGQTFPYELWRNGGEDMATVEGNASSNLFVPHTQTEFDTVDVNISNFKEQDIILRFTAKNDRGSVVYIDNVRLSTYPFNNINSFEMLNDFQIYPNPALNYFVIEADDFSKHEYIDMYNCVGQKLMQIKLLSKRTTINISDLPAGIYFIRSSNYSQSKRLIIK